MWKLGVAVGIVVIVVEVVANRPLIYHLPVKDLMKMAVDIFAVGERLCIVR